MIDALSTPRNRIVTLILLLICGSLATAAAFLGVDDNPPGILLAFLAAIALVLAFIHPWRTTRKFMFLLLASIISFVLYIILNIIIDSIVQNPTASTTIKNLFQSPTADAISIAISMICAAALVIGAVGSVVMFIRSRQQRKTNT